MIPYRLKEEKEIVVRYANLFSDQKTLDILESGTLSSQEEAIHLAEFFWKMVEASNKLDEENNESSEYILEKVIITFMAFFNASGYDQEWEEVTDKH